MMSFLVCSHHFYILLGLWPFLHMLLGVLEGVWFWCGYMSISYEGKKNICLLVCVLNHVVSAVTAVQ